MGDKVEAVCQSCLAFLERLFGANPSLEVTDRNKRHVVRFGKSHEFGRTHHGTVLSHDFAA